MLIDILTGEKPLNFAEISVDSHPLCKHLGMVMQLANDHGINLSKDAANIAVTSFINSMCISILETTAVFKNTEKGNLAFAKFMESNNFTFKS